MRGQLAAQYPAWRTTTVCLYDGCHFEDDYLTWQEAMDRAMRIVNHPSNNASDPRRCRVHRVKE